MISRRTLLRAALVAPTMVGCAPLRIANAGNTVRPAAPFDMPAIRIPDFSDAQRFNITDYGAVEGNQERTTRAIALAIAAAHATGRGRVVVPRGTWPTAAIHLKSNVNLHLEADATLLFSSNPEDYLPAVMTSWEGIECFNYSPLVYAFECENIALTGKGRLQAKLDVWRLWYERPKAHMDALVTLYQQAVRNVPVQQRQMAVGAKHLRPHFIQFNRCRNVLIEDIAIRDSPFWTVHPYLCRDVVIRRVDIRAHGHNNDGIDPEMSQNVLIENCIFDQGDDAISVKSGREFDGWRLGVPAKNIVIRGCRIRNGHQLLALGSELSGGIENVFVDDCHFERAEPWQRQPGDHVVETNNILYVKTNERRGGFVRNIHVNNVTAEKVAGGALCVETDILYQWRDLVPTYERRLTPIEGLHMSNIRIGESKFVCRILAEAELPVRDVTLRRVSSAKVSGTAILTRNVEGFVNQPQG